MIWGKIIQNTPPHNIQQTNMLLSDNSHFTATNLHQLKIEQLFLLQILSFFTKIFQNIIQRNDKHLQVLMFLQLEYPRFI